MSCLMFVSLFRLGSIYLSILAVYVCMYILVCLPLESVLFCYLIWVWAVYIIIIIIIIIYFDCVFLNISI